ncbi:MAG: hypothetical protein ACE5EO_10905 [Candidatus Krumholzibacteriia bacterium]
MFLFLIAGTLFSTADTDVAALGHEFLAPDHWCYDALYRFESLGLVDLPSHKLFSRDDVISYTEAIERALAASDGRPSARDRFELERLRKEFSSPESRADPRVRYNPPLLHQVDGPFELEGDLDLSLVPTDPLAGERWQFLGVSQPVARLHVEDKVTYETRYRLTMGPERGARVRDRKPSRRERSFRGLTSLFERSYVVFPWKQATLFWGRDYVDWGPGEDGNLLVSQSAESLDKFGARLRFKNLHVSTFHANLSTEARRYLSAHRLELDLGRLVVAVSEAVLYLDRGFDPAYILPLSSFYSNQFNERSDDNILWSFDLKYRTPLGAVLYGGFLIDDFQFERRNVNPDKIAFDVGARVAMAGPVPMTWRLRYRFVDAYTYTHRDSGKAFVVGAGDPAAGDPSLGAEQGPDRDRLQVRADFYPRRDVTSTVSFSFQRRGEANDFRRFVEGTDPSPPFPLGIVEKTYAFGYRVEWELPGNSLVGVDVRHEYVRNIDHAPGVSGWQTAVRGHLTWDFR